MNTLSWLIYFAGLVNSLAIIALLVSVVCFSIWFGARIFFMLDNGMITKEDQEKLPSGTYLLIGFLCAVILILAPTRNTILLIAASEFGQKLVTSQQVVDVVDPSLDLLKTWIKKETEALKGK